MYPRPLIALTLALALTALGVLAVPADTVSATHSWGGYHWARTANPFTLKVGDNVSGAWDASLSVAATDWTKSTVLDMAVVVGQSIGRCRPTAGRVEVCNSKYGQTGWLGVAQIWVSGTQITQGTVKLNDTYFATAQYNTPGWRAMVTCQEVGHTLGLDHQDETFTNTNLGTCMDYTNDPTGTAGTNGPLSNEHPNQHDYDELALIYAHTDGSTTVGAATAPGASGAAGNPFGDEGPDDPAQFGRPVGPRDSFGRPILFVRDTGGGRQLFTWVFWAHPGQPGAPTR